MQLPIVGPAPVVMTHCSVFKDLFENHCQFDHFQNYLTGLMVLEDKGLANISRCILDSSDKTNLSRFFSQAPWVAEEINTRRVQYMLEQTQAYRGMRTEKGCLIIDDTLCEHTGTLFEHIDRHYNHCDNTYPLAHNMVTSHFLSGMVRLPIDVRLYRRYEEITQWEKFVHKYFPEQKIPKGKKERAKLHKKLDPVLLEDSEFRALDRQFRTKISQATELVRKAEERGVPFSTVLFDSWYLSEELVTVLTELEKDWISLVKKNRNIEINSFVLKDEAGQPISMSGPYVKVEDLVSLIPRNAYQKICVGEHTYWCFTLSVRIPTLGKVRVVISFANEQLDGTCAVLVTNRLDWGARQIIATYLQRWPIETFYQDSKGHLGLDEYRMRSIEAIKKHWCLVFVAYSLLHLDCLSALLTEGKFSVKTIGEACRRQAQALIQKLVLYTHEKLVQGQNINKVFGSLFSKQGVFTGAAII